MNYLLFSIFAVSILCSCGQSKTAKDNIPIGNVDEMQISSLANTKWECKIAEGCVNVYEFKIDSSFLFYSCEMEDSLFGEYYFKGDTLILDEKGSIYDEKYPEGSIHRIGRKMYWVNISEDKLRHLKMSEWINGKFEKSDFKFNDDYLYSKVK